MFVPFFAVSFEPSFGDRSYEASSSSKVKVFCSRMLQAQGSVCIRSKGVERSAVCVVALVPPRGVVLAHLSVRNSTDIKEALDHIQE